MIPNRFQIDSKNDNSQDHPEMESIWTWVGIIYPLIWISIVLALHNIFWTGI
jgi:hypothetical protein